MKEPYETEEMAHEPLRAIVDHYNAIMNSTNEAIIRKSMDGVITGWSRGAESIFGYTRNEMIGQTIQRLLPDDRLDDESRVFARIKQDAPVKTFDTVRIRKDGESVHVSVSVSPISDDLGNVTGVSTIARDRRVELEMEETRRTLADSEARFRGAFETAAHGMALVSIEGKFIVIAHAPCES